ncbi:MAG: DUF4382 domain-containing protein [bacterium]|jgi:hypothetical protein
MKKMKFYVGLTSMLLMFALVFSACDKNAVDGGSNLELYLTDGPGEFDEVNIDIQKVEVKVDKDEDRRNDDNGGDGDDDRDDHLRRRDEFGEWIDIGFAPAVINVLTLRNGVEQKLGDANIEKGTVRKIRITLGTNNTVVKDDVSHDLTLINLNPNTNYFYIKLFNRHRERANRSGIRVWVDFDIANSIMEVNGQYFLKPVLRPFCNANFGAIAGSVSPLNAAAVVRITDGDAFNSVALPNSEGRFMIRGLEEGAYTLTYEGAPGYTPQTKTNVIVTKGKITRVDPVTLVQ